MNNLYGRIPNVRNTARNLVSSASSSLSSSLNAVVGNTTNASSMMNSDKMAWVYAGVLFLVFFVVIVIYYKTIGLWIQAGWERLLKIVGRGDTEIQVAVDPGQTGTAAVTTTLLPNEPTMNVKDPEPVALPTNFDAPPTDNMLPPEERPAGMPGSEHDAGTQTLLSSLEKKPDYTPTPGKKEVFNISRNIYTFHDAAAVCAAAGAELATYDQVKEAYAGGADWCNYGWVKGQMAVYPTQAETYAKLQKGAPEFRNACGVPGVNGGYFDNPELRFGVNCYGVKPAQKATDELLDSQVALPQTAEEIEFEKKVQRFRDQMDNATILPFQKGRWTE